MSISQLQYVDNLFLNNVSLGSNGQATSQGTIGNINISNNLISNLGIPNATWTIGCFPSTANIPNALVMAVSTNDPVTPILDTIVMTPSGGSGDGNGTIVSIAGDLSVEGRIISGSGASYNGKIDDDNIESGVNSADESYLSGIINNCLTSVDFTSRVCHVWVNVEAKNESGVNGLPFTIAQTPATTSALLQIFTNTPAIGQIPPPNSDDLSGYFQGVYFNTNTPANNTQVPFYWVWNGGQIYLYNFQNSALTVGENDNIQLQGYFTYLF
jgi:hypothetical protein